MDSEDFYLAMERLINPEPLDPEEALADLVQALHEQLLVRVKSVANGEAYLKSHPGSCDLHAFKRQRYFPCRWPLGRLFNAKPRFKAPDRYGCGT